MAPPRLISPVTPSTPSLSKFAADDETEVTSIKVRRISYRSEQRPSVRQVELPDTVYMPRLTLSSATNITAPDVRVSAPDSKPNTSNFRFQIPLNSARTSVASSRYSRNSQGLSSPPVPLRQSYQSILEKIVSSRDGFRSKDTVPISKEFSSLPVPPPPRAFVPVSSPLRPLSRNSTFSPSPKLNSRPPLVRPPRNEGGAMLPSRPAPIPSQLGRTTPIPSQSGRTTPIPSQLGGTTPIPSQLGRTTPIPSQLGRTTPIPSQLGRSVSFASRESAQSGRYYI